MNGAYGGSMLSVFPELMKTYEVFKMKPFTGGGYGPRYDKRNVQGYWSWRRSGKMGIEGDQRVPNHHATFWVQSYFLGNKTAINQNDYVEVDDEVFLVVQNDNFTHEGGFYKCLMQKAAGLTDRQYTNPNVDKVIRSDY